MTFEEPKPVVSLAETRCESTVEEIPIDILIVDDEASNLLVLEAVLDDPSYRLVRALSADEALRALISRDFALLILDIHMPGMTGFDLARMLKTIKRTASVPIIFLTARYSEEKHVLEGYQSGAVDYLYKPVNGPVLRAKVAAFAELHRKTRRSELAGLDLLAQMAERSRAEEKLSRLNTDLEQRVVERTGKLMEANAALSESESFNRSILESSGDCIKVLDLEGRILSMNSPGLKIMEIPDFETIRGKEWPSLWPPDSGSLINASLAAARKGQEARFQSFCPTAKGTPKWWDVLVSPILHKDGHVVQIVSVARDITTLREANEAGRRSQERLDLVMAGAELGAWDWQVESGLVHYDQRWAEVLGLTPGEVEDNYRFFEERIHPEDLEPMNRILEEHLAGRTPSFRAEIRLRHRNGEWVWVMTCGRVVERRANGSPVRACGIQQDITERRRAEETLRQMDKRKDEFLAMLGHELRNPLGAIRHALRIEREVADDAATRVWSRDVLERQSLQLARLVDDLLDVARIDRGRIELRLELLDLRTVLSRAQATVQSLIEERNHRVTFCAGTAELWVSADAVRLEQVFVNLLTNAAKYTPPGGEIHIEVHSRGEEAVVSVADTGIGLNPEMLSQVFNLFTQAGNSIDRSQGGLGIGLTVVKSLIEKQGGSIVAVSKGLGHGSTFTVRLPLKQTPASVPNALPPVATPLESAPVCRVTRLLIVDDNRDAADGLARLLVRRGYEVRTAYDGHRGLELAREFKPEALLLDLGLPGLDGYTVCRTLRAEAPFTAARFIAISGYAQASDVAHSLSVGFDEHFTKPLDITALLHRLASHFA